MSSATVSVKRQNHRVHPCPAQRKPELLTLLLERNKESTILIVTANDPEPIQKAVSGDNVTVVSDAALADTHDLRCDLLISYDLPATAAAYMARLAHAKTHALILLDPKEQERLYPVETLLGRSLMQETISGFEPETAAASHQEKKTFKGKKLKHEHKTARGEKPNSYAHKKKSAPRGKKASDTQKGRRKPAEGAAKTKSPRGDVQKASSKRPPRRITIKSLKSQKESE
jgi:hypothetical protein